MANNPIKQSILGKVADKVIRNQVKNNFPYPVNNTGYVLGGAALPNSATMLNPVPDQNAVRAIEPYGTTIPRLRQDRTTGYSQIANLSNNFDLQKVQAAFRTAENGDTRLLFTYYRDFFINNSQVVTELSKRKLSTLSEKFNILPIDKNNKDDVRAAEVIKELILDCSTFNYSLTHAMNAIVFPVAILEKTFEPITDMNYGDNKFNLNYRIKELYPVDYNLVSYKLPYQPQVNGFSTINVGNKPVVTSIAGDIDYDALGIPQDIVYNPDSWEPDIRFWPVLPNGNVIQSPAMLIAPDPNRHMIYRCDLLAGIAPENFGGVGKSLLFLSIMAQLGLNVFLNCLQKFGLPFIVAKVDTTSIDTVNSIVETFGNMSSVISAIAVNKDAVVELQEMNYSGASDAHRTFLEYINDQISMLICGQTLSSHTKSTGMGSGVANLQSSVRDDFINYDRDCLNNLLRHQLFKQLLEINNIKGAVPQIVWGGSSSTQDKVNDSIMIMNLKNAGIELSDDSIDDLSIKTGYKFIKTDAPEVIPDIKETPKVNETKEETIPNE